MSQTLFIAWRSGSHVQGQWGPVGRLDKTDDGYRFVYTKGARMLEGFHPFPGMPDMEQVYESDELFPLFSNRLLGKSRPEYQAYLAWSGFRAQEQPEPIAILSVTEGRRATDSYELFPCPVRSADDRLYNTFFAHGIRHVSEEVKKKIANLTVKDKLLIHLEDDNPKDKNAVSLRLVSEQNDHLGYVPRYMAYDVRQLVKFEDIENVEIRVKRVNGDAPIQQRLLCELSAPWPAGFEPCSAEEFQSIATHVVA